MDISRVAAQLQNVAEMYLPDPLISSKEQSLARQNENTARLAASLLKQTVKIPNWKNVTTISDYFISKRTLDSYTGMIDPVIKNRIVVMHNAILSVALASVIITVAVIAAAAFTALALTFAPLTLGGLTGLGSLSVILIVGKSALVGFSAGVTVGLTLAPLTSLLSMLYLTLKTGTLKSSNLKQLDRETIKRHFEILAIEVQKQLESMTPVEREKAKEQLKTNLMSLADHIKELTLTDAESNRSFFEPLIRLSFVKENQPLQENAYDKLKYHLKIFERIHLHKVTRTQLIKTLKRAEYSRIIIPYLRASSLRKEAAYEELADQLYRKKNDLNAYAQVFGLSEEETQVMHKLYEITQHFNERPIHQDKNVLPT